MQIIGIDIGGTRIKGALLNSRLKVLKREEIDTEADKGKEIVLKNIKKIYLKLSNGFDIKGIGVSFPGVILQNGTVVDAPHIPSIEGVNLKKLFQKRSVVFENDANCFSFGELIAGAAKERGIKNIVGIPIGTGVGSGIIIDRKIYKGSGGAGEIGHNPTLNGILEKRVVFGRRGDFDSELGWPGIDNEYRKRGGALKSPMAKEILKSRDPVALKLKEDLCIKLGILVAEMVNALAPDAVVIGGGVGIHFPIRRVKHYAKLFSFPPNYLGCKVLRSKLKDNASIVGAAALALEEYQSH